MTIMRLIAHPYCRELLYASFFLKKAVAIGGPAHSRLSIVEITSHFKIPRMASVEC